MSKHIRPPKSFGNMADLHSLWSDMGPGSQIAVVGLGLGLVTVLWRTRPPRPLDDRLAVIPESAVQIDNDDGYTHFDWHHKYNPLTMANAARLPFFIEQLKRHFGNDEPLLQGKTVLDMGCGGGVLTEELARQTQAQVIGLDLNHASIVKARAHSRLPVERLQYVEGSAYRLPFADASVDAVVCSDVFEHLHDLALAMSEIRRVLRKGGMLVYDTVNRTWLSWYLTIVIAQQWVGYIHDHAHDWRLYITPDEMRRVAAQAGLEHAPLSELRGMRPTVPYPWQIVRRWIDGAGIWALLDRWTWTSHSQVSYLSTCIKR